MAKKKKDKTKKAPVKTGKKAFTAPKPKQGKSKKRRAVKAAPKSPVKAKTRAKVSFKARTAKAAVKKVMAKKAPVKKAPPKKQPAKKPVVKKDVPQKKAVKKEPAVKPTVTKEPPVPGKKAKTPFHGIRAFFHPRTIAVWGANETPKKLGRIILEKILSGPFKGKVFPISQRKMVLKLKAYSSIRRIKDPVDLVIFVSKKDASRAALQECGRKNVKAVMILTAGEAEHDNKADKELKKFALSYGFRLLGPGNVGAANTDSRVMLNATTLNSTIPLGKACLVTDSGSIGETIVHQAQIRGFGISRFISLGSKIDVTENDCLEYSEKESSVGYLMLFLRSISNSHNFVENCRRISRKKPIAVLKAPESIQEVLLGKSILAGLSKKTSPDKFIWDKCGIIACDGLEDFINMGVALGKMPIPAGNRVGIIANGVGPGTMAKSGCLERGLEVNPLQVKNLSGLPPVIQKNPKKTNPIVLPAGLGSRGYWDALQAMIKEKGVDIIITLFSPSRGFDDIETAKFISKAWREMKSKRKYPKPVFPVWMVEKPETGEGPVGILRDAGLQVFKFPLDAIKVANGFAKYWRWSNKAEGAIPKFDVDVEKAERIISRAVLEGREFLSDSEGQALLECYGIPVVPTVVTGSLIAARKHAVKMGYPLVLKGSSDGLINKSDMKVVYLDIPVERELVSTYQKIEGQLRKKWDKPFRIMMQPMVDAGVDLIISTVNLPNYAPMLLLGLGGGLIGAAHSIKLIPLSDIDGRELIDGYATYPMFKGTGNKAGLALDGLIELVLRFSQLVNTHREIVEFDLDPLRAFPGGGFIVLDQMIHLALQK